MCFVSDRGRKARSPSCVDAYFISVGFLHKSLSLSPRGWKHRKVVKRELNLQKCTSKPKYFSSSWSPEMHRCKFSIFTSFDTRAESIVVQYPSTWPLQKPSASIHSSSHFESSSSNNHAEEISSDISKLTVVQQESIDHISSGETTKNLSSDLFQSDSENF